MMAGPQHSKLIAARLRAGALPQPSVHPDADLLSAFSEGCLNQTERAKILEHLAECNVCRDVVYLAQPEADTLQPVKTPSRARWFVSGGVRWAALAASMSVVVAIAILVRNNPERLSPTAVSDSDKQASPRGNVQPNISTSEPHAQSYESSPVAQTAEDTKNKESGATLRKSRSGAAADLPALASRRASSRDEKDLGSRSVSEAGKFDRLTSANDREPAKKPLASDLERRAIAGGTISSPGKVGASEEKGKLFDLRQQRNQSGPYSNVSPASNAQMNQVYPPRDSQSYSGNLTASPAAVRPDKNGIYADTAQQASVKPSPSPADGFAKKKVEQPVVPAEETHRKNLETIPAQSPAPKEEETVAAAGRLQTRDRVTKTSAGSSGELQDEARPTQPSDKVAKIDDMHFGYNGAANPAPASAGIPSGAITGWRVHRGRVQERLYGIWHNVVVGGAGNLKTTPTEVLSSAQEAVAIQPRFAAVTAVRSDVWAVQAIGREQSYVVVDHSHDSGLTWQASTLVAVTVLSPSAQVSISFKDPMRGELALSTGQRWQTADGGAHWTVLK